MRFANVPALKPVGRAPAAEFLRRLIGAPVSNPPLARRAAFKPGFERQTEELPRELDQRVRLVGEW